MKRIKRIALVVLLTVGMFSVVSTMEVSAQAAQDFTLVNKTGVEINALYVTPHNADAWGEDILGADTLLNGETLDISFSRKERAKLWDLRVEDDDGNFIEWENLNLLEISKVTLFYKNGKATAIVE
jgi:hypothetical protein